MQGKGCDQHLDGRFKKVHYRALEASLLIAVGFAVGCGGPPQVGVNNYRLVEGLRTAVSARRTDWLEDTAQVIKERHASGELNDEPFAALEAIIVQARDAQWKEAESEVVRLAKAQHASAEEQQRMRAKKAVP